jgi:hypothetical protein
MKKIVLFGSGTVAELNLHLEPAFIVDNNPDLQGNYFHGLEIRQPIELKDQSSQYHVVVCTTSITEVKKQLLAYGFIWGVTAYAADLLSEKAAISDLEDSRFRFLTSSGLPSTAESFSGGGIHLVEETDEGYPKIRNLYQGNTHGLIKTRDGFAVTCQGKGVILFNSELEIINEIPVRKGLRPHGLKQYDNLWVLVCSNGDCLIGIKDDGEEVFCYSLSNKLEKYKSAQHHCNDLEIIGDYAYVSMFSVSGNWKRSIFDGGIIEIDLVTGTQNIINNTLTMPHSITKRDDGFYILDSFKGRLLGPNFTELAQLPGFVRGFDSSQEYYFVGESKNRNFSRLETSRSPVSIDSRITIINKQHRFSRSIPLPRNVSEIHSIICLEKDCH